MTKRGWLVTSCMFAMCWSCGQQGGSRPPQGAGDASTLADGATSGDDAGAEPPRDQGAHPDVGLAGDAPVDGAVDVNGSVADAAGRDGAPDASPRDQGAHPDVGLAGDASVDGAADAAVSPSDAGVPDAIAFDGATLPPLGCARAAVGTLPSPQTGVWSRELVEGDLELVNQYAAPSQWGSGTSVAVTSAGELHVGYYTNQFICATAGALRHARRTTAGWVRDTVSCRESGYWSRARVDAADRVHVVYASGLASSYQYARYARWNGSLWEYPTEPISWGYMRDGPVDLTIGCDGRPIALANGALAVQMLASVDFAVAGTLFDQAAQAHIERDSAGRLHVAASPAVPTGPSSRTYMTRYALWDGATWSVEDPTGDAGGSTLGLVIDSSARPHVLYRVRDGSTGNFAVMHAVRDASGWVRDTVLTATVPAAGAVAIDGADELVVVHGSQLARRAAAAGGSWTTATVAQLIGAEYTSMVIDAAGTLHLTFYLVGVPSGTYHDYPATVYHASLASP